MTWKKLGWIFSPSGDYPWMFSHAANPVAEHVTSDIYRIYFNCRDKTHRSYIASLEIDLKFPQQVRSLSPKPLFSPGKLGTFDESGVSLGCLLNIQGKKWLYYLGWNLGPAGLWQNTIGLAVYDELSHKFIRHDQNPILDQNQVDPFTLSYPFVIRENRKYKMWYGANLEANNQKKNTQHVIKYAQSQDGVTWTRRGEIVLSFKRGEFAHCRPCVLRNKNKYQMWFSYKHEHHPGYRIGYAESVDGFNWQRQDEKSAIGISTSGWDKEMMAYPFVFNHKDKRYLLYCGNDYGKSGFGLAGTKL